MINQTASIGSMADTIEHQLICGLLDNLGYTLHDVRHERPGQRRHQYAQQRGPPSSQAGSGSAGNILVLIHNVHDALAGHRVYVGLVVQHTRYRSCGYAGEASYVSDSQAAWHGTNLHSRMSSQDTRVRPSVSFPATLKQ